jgi:hypothetical protein
VCVRSRGRANSRKQAADDRQETNNRQTADGEQTDSRLKVDRHPTEADRQTDRQTDRQQTDRQQTDSTQTADRQQAARAYGLEECPRKGWLVTGQRMGVRELSLLACRGRIMALESNSPVCYRVTVWIFIE